jgi:hypothetical protein
LKCSLFSLVFIRSFLFAHYIHSYFSHIYSLFFFLRTFFRTFFPRSISLIFRSFFAHFSLDFAHFSPVSAHFLPIFNSFFAHFRLFSVPKAMVAPNVSRSAPIHRRFSLQRPLKTDRGRFFCAKKRAKMTGHGRFRGPKTPFFSVFFQCRTRGGLVLRRICEWVRRILVIWSYLYIIWGFLGSQREKKRAKTTRFEVFLRQLSTFILSCFFFFFFFCLFIIIIIIIKKAMKLTVFPPFLVKIL